MNAIILSAYPNAPYSDFDKNLTAKILPTKKNVLFSNPEPIISKSPFLYNFFIFSIISVINF